MGSSNDGSPGPVSEPGTRSPDLPDEPPPFGGSWRALYAAVAGTLAALVVLFYAFTKAFE